MRPALLRNLLAVSTFTLLLPTTTLATDVLPGFDLFQTDDASTHFDFAGSPLPADFFYPGSDPFADLVLLGGSPLGSHAACPNDDLSAVDTIVERLQQANLPDENNSTDTIEIEIVALSLVSIQPITVTEQGGQNPELWDVEVFLSDAVPQQTGTMTVRHTNPAGGTFDSDLPVFPKFIFTRVSDNQVIEFDTGFFSPPLIFTVRDVPWVHHPPPANSCTSNFCVNPENVTVFDAVIALHGVISNCPEDPTQTLEATWGSLKSTYR